MESDDNSYQNELLAKWSSSLLNVHDIAKLHVAQRLEAAYRRTLGSNGDQQALQNEMNVLDKEGYFRKQADQPAKQYVKHKRRKKRKR